MANIKDLNKQLASGSISQDQYKKALQDKYKQQTSNKPSVSKPTVSKPTVSKPTTNNTYRPSSSTSIKSSNNSSVQDLNSQLSSGSITQEQYKQAMQDRYNQATNKPSTSTVTQPTTQPVQKPSTTQPVQNSRPEFFLSAGGKRQYIWYPDSGQPYKAGMIRYEGSNKAQIDSMLQYNREQGTIDRGDSTGVNLPIVSKPPTTNQTPSYQTDSNLNNQLREQQKKLAIENLRKALEQQRQRQTQTSMQERGRIGVQDTMSRQALSNIQATQGLSGSGAANQSTIAQNIAQQGALSSSASREQQAMQDINLAESQGVANIEMQDIQSRENELLRMQELDRQEQIRQQEIARQDQIRQEGFAREDALREQQLALQQQQMQSQQEQEAFQQQLNTIGQYSGDYQAEINRREAINPNDPLLPYLRIARQQKIQEGNLDPVTGQPIQQGVQYSIPQALDAFRIIGYATPEIASALGIQPNTKYTQYKKTSTKKEEPKYKTNVFDSGIKNSIDALTTYDDYGQPIFPDRRRIMNITSDFIVREYENGNMTESQAEELRIKYNLTPQDIINAETRSDNAKEYINSLQGR